MFYVLIIIIIIIIQTKIIQTTPLGGCRYVILMLMFSKNPLVRMRCSQQWAFLRQGIGWFLRQGKRSSFSLLSCAHLAEASEASGVGLGCRGGFLFPGRGWRLLLT